MKTQFEESFQKIHDAVCGLIIWLKYTKHPGEESIQRLAEAVYANVIHRNFTRAEVLMMELIDLARRFDIVWDGMDALAVLQNLKKAEELEIEMEA